MAGSIVAILGAVIAPPREPARKADERPAPTDASPEGGKTPRGQGERWPERAVGGGPRPNWLLVFAFFLVLAIVQTWPLALHMNDHVIGWERDSYVMWWNLHWVKESILGLSNPYHTDALFYPQGADLYLHTLHPVNGLLAAPLIVLTDNILLSWNILMLAFFALSGTGGYALACHITRDRWASLLGGFVFAFSPHVMMQLNAAHVNIATTWPIPFFVLFLWRFFERPNWRDIVLAGVFGAIITWNWVEYAVDMAVFATLLLCVWTWVRIRAGRASEIALLVRRMLPGLAVYAVLSAPIVIWTALDIASGEYTTLTDLNAARYYSPDLFAYAIPSPLWGPGEFAVNYERPYSTMAGSVETTMFLGVTPLFWGAAALVLRRRSPVRGSILFWSGAFLFLAVLSLGPYLRVLGVDSGIPLPFRLLQEVPLAGERRVPGRMIIPGMLALGVLASIGVSVIAAGYGRGVRHAGPLLAGLALTLVVFEFWSPPVSLSTYDVPDVYREIGKEPGEFAVLDLPLGRPTGNKRAGDPWGAMADYAQTFHGKSAVGGYLSRAKDADMAWIEETPGFGYLSCLDCVGYPRSSDMEQETVRELFAELRVKYAVLNLATFEGEPSTLVTRDTAGVAGLYLTETLGFQEYASGDGWVAYRNPAVE